MEITVLCKVVDNFGDIGVCWRMCRQLKKKYPEVKINLIVDGLDSFKKIWNEVNVSVPYQIVEEIAVYDWNSYDYCYNDFSSVNQNRLQVILECFQCGRPDWMEKILFEDELNHVVQIIMIDYLTAEKYAEDFHKLLSLTRKAKVRKVNFMPGFTEKTGGLVIDENWKELSERDKNGPVLFFTYDKSEKFWKNFLEGYKKAGVKNKAFIAQGKGFKPLKDAFSYYCNSDDYEELPFVNLEDWDKLMKKSSALVIRGEESMSRACVSGIPFIWHAYPQTDEYQMVKMQALLDRMSLHFKDEDFDVVREIWNVFNLPENELNPSRIRDAAYNFFKNLEKLTSGFKEFAKNLINNGDLVSNLMTFINEIYIM